MRSPSLTVLAVCLVVWTLVGAAFCSWVLRCTFNNANVVLSEHALRHVTTPLSLRNSDVLCPFLFRRFSTVQFTMTVTLATNGSMLLSVMVYGTWLALATLVYSDKDYEELPKHMDAIFYSVVFFTLVGYALMFVTHFERLRLTFCRTSHRLPKWAPNILYAFTFTFLAVATLGNVIQNNSVTTFCDIVVISAYFAAICALIRTFYRKTMAVASAREQVDYELVYTAARVTVSAIVSVISTTVVFLLWNCAKMFLSNCFFCELVCNSFITLDLCVNAFCLLCTFRQAESYYKFAFGRLHALLLARVAMDATEVDMIRKSPPQSVAPEITAEHSVSV